jgi:MYXO-CTERM domain-containing protein
MRIDKIVFILSITLFARVDAVRGQLAVENIRFLERVTPSGGGGDSQSTFFEFPPSPNHIAFSQTATIPPSYSTGTYDVQWSGDNAYFQISIDHHLQGFRGGLLSNGTIIFRPAVDSFVTLNGTWTYNHYPAMLGSTVFGMRVVQPGAPNPWSDQKPGGTDYLLPPSGTLTLSGSATLQAGVRYSVGYNISTDNFSNPGAPPAIAAWLGTGFIDITVQPVPEPAALALLAAAMPFLIRRRRRCMK